MKTNEFIELAKKDQQSAITCDLKSDAGWLAKGIYKIVFDFYSKDKFTGDVIFSWRSPSLVKDGDFIGKRIDPKYNGIENNHFIGNLFPNFFTDKKFSLNTNRNGMMGDFPHDYFDIFLCHVAKYGYDKKDIPIEVKEYYPLKRAIEYEDNKNFFKSFETFENYLEKNFFTEIWEYICNEKPFSDMEFEEYQREALKLIKSRGEKMIQKLIK
ncbi:hypothetical protein [Enterococcus faecalis]|uniref:hypothetical protein n=1 Tax=Enterococcus faecalis TaxID=1351 RepID=UPI0024C01818|nr:hypothetical protein [Enterococcus faecalis]MDK0488493.1 hypothetical protein [Enterococcus faecalis]MDK0510373.1 hypothetical protein [Enterococcus faecalis]